MSSRQHGPQRQLSCSACRIRIRAAAPQRDPLECLCPICGASLETVASAAQLIGFRVLEPGPSDPEQEAFMQAEAAIAMWIPRP